MNKQKEIFLMIFLIFLLFAINYKWVDNAIINFLEESEIGIVERVIDGDTLVINGNNTRLLGINTPEKGEKYYNEAKNFLSNLTLNKTVKLEYIGDKYDKYKRKLAYIIIGDKNINIEIVKNGFANLYIYDKDKYTSDLKRAWSECLMKNTNLCEKSNHECANCIELKNLDIKTQTIVFYNNCDFDCDLSQWVIKDEGRKKFTFNNFTLNSKKEVKIIVGNKTNTDDVLYWNDKEYVWTSRGDTLFLRDDEGKLVMWKEINR
jgi:micrococcal nuclease